MEVLLRTGQRMSDITDLVESEVDFDERTLTLPANRFKGDRQHVIPLPTQVVDLLKTVDRPDRISERLFQRLGQEDRNVKIIRAKMEVVADEPVPHWSIHTLRKTVDTHLREAWDEEADRSIADHDVIKGILGHSLKGVSKHYNFSTMLRNKWRVLTWWNAYLDKLMAENELAQAA